jgi:hypothetical protein
MSLNAIAIVNAAMPNIVAIMKGVALCAVMVANPRLAAAAAPAKL